MGNELTGDQQTGQVLNLIQTNFANNPDLIKIQANQDPNSLANTIENPQKSPSPNSKNYSAFRGSKFVRGDEGSFGYQSRFGQDVKLGRKDNQNPNSNNHVAISRVVEGYRTQSPNNVKQSRADVDPALKKSPTKKQSSSPFNFFQNFFGAQKSQTQSKLRSSSVSNAAMNQKDRKIALLESNLQVSEQKIDSLAKSAQSLQQRLKNCESALNKSQSTLFQSQQSTQQLQQRCQFLQSQLQGQKQQLQRLQQILMQKDSLLYQRDKSISELQMQTRTQKNQIVLLESRLNQCAIREERKDKQLRDISLAKFQLNSIKIRLENNLHVVEDQVLEKQRKIEELDGVIGGNHKEIEGLKGKSEQLVLDLLAKSSQLQAALLRNEQQKNSLNSRIKGHLLTIEQNSTQIHEMNSKIDKYYENQLQNQATIDNLQNTIMDNKDEIRKLQGQLQNLTQNIENLHKDFQELKKSEQAHQQEVSKHKQIGQAILNDFHSAKKIGQKQIQFLQSKLQQQTRQKQLLIEELELTKSVATQRNQIFERSIIYELKKQNDKLWAKLIDKSNVQADAQGDDPNYWKNRLEQEKKLRGKDQQKVMNKVGSRDQLEMRFEDFVKKLDGQASVSRQNGNNITRDVSNQSLSKLQQNVDFYRQKCNELQKMVQTHITLNKTMKEQLQKYTNYELAFQTYRSQIDNLIQSNKKLSAQLSTLKSTTPQNDHELKQKRLQSKVKELELQNKKYFQDIQRIKGNVDVSRNQGRRYQEDVNRMNAEILVYKKWQALYDQLKVKFDALVGASKEDYKGMYEELGKQLQRLRGLYELKQGDFQKLKKSTSHRIQTLQKQLKLKQAQSETSQQNLNHLSQQYTQRQQQLQQLISSNQNLQKQLSYLKQTKQKQSSASIAFSKQTLQKMAAVLKSKIAELQSSVQKIKLLSGDQDVKKMQDIGVEAGRCETVLRNCLLECNKVLGGG